MRPVFAAVLLIIVLIGSLYMLHKSTRYEAYVLGVRELMYMRHCVELHGEQARRICQYNWDRVDE